jgi:DNA-binding MarR family transcriptional regulator
MTNFSLDDSPGYLFNVVASLFKRELNDQFRQAGIDVLAEQWPLIYRIYEKGGINQQDLAESTFRDNASITRSLILLESKQLIERRQPDHDRRNRYLYLTRKGEELLPALIQCAHRSVERALQGMSPQEASLLNNLVTRMIQNLNS